MTLESVKSRRVVVQKGVRKGFLLARKVTSLTLEESIELESFKKKRRREHF
jgi:hypothetical protein